MARKELRPAVAYLRTSSAANTGANKDSGKRQRATIDAFARSADRQSLPRTHRVLWMGVAKEPRKEPEHQPSPLGSPREELVRSAPIRVAAQPPGMFTPARSSASVLRSARAHRLLRPCVLLWLRRAAGLPFQLEAPGCKIGRMKVGERVFRSAPLIAGIEIGFEHAVWVMRPQYDVFRVNLHARTVGQNVRARLIDVRNIAPTKLHVPSVATRIAQVGSWNATAREVSLRLKLNCGVGDKTH